MPKYAYLDASALVKLAVHEPETPALEQAVLDRDGLFTSVVGAIEFTRALTRTGRAVALNQADDVLEALFLADLTPMIRAQASRLEPPTLRTLDAIHIATAASLSLPELDFVTYDDRQVQAARARGLRVLQPGVAKKL
jgi:predicted nucleic acid-binding protein